ncbi:hypothetical protein COLO4_02534 [Corchorus olitorius]|uniref:Uncharacterized protein n=1 Tax=Corchorus olitorius TaxID=93759 RepID=A0A1R3L0X6_9ROSI|nr:hypothetical protein COLO4_02534 [Corchorus olitorius]
MGKRSDRQKPFIGILFIAPTPYPAIGYFLDSSPYLRVSADSLVRVFVPEIVLSGAITIPI